MSRVRPQPEEEEESEEEVTEPEKEATAPPATTEDDESDHVPVVPKKRKPRKVVPVGRNGLKKRRVVKSRTTTDAKGYMRMSSCVASRGCCLILYSRDGRLLVVRVC
jgi:DNA polymerase delta subunit 3